MYYIAETPRWFMVIKNGVIREVMDMFDTFEEAENFIDELVGERALAS